MEGDVITPEQFAIQGLEAQVSYWMRQWGILRKEERFLRERVRALLEFHRVGNELADAAAFVVKNVELGVSLKGINELQEAVEKWRKV